MKKLLICLFAVLISICVVNVAFVGHSYAKPVVDDVVDDGGGGGGGNVPEDGEGGESPDGSDTNASINDGHCTSLLGDSWCNGNGNTIIDLLKVVARILTAGVIILGTVGMIWCGFLMLTARDNEAQVAAARKRLIDIVIGIALFVLGNLLINLIFPGKDSGQGLL